MLRVTLREVRIAESAGQSSLSKSGETHESTRCLNFAPLPPPALRVIEMRCCGDVMDFRGVRDGRGWLFRFLPLISAPSVVKTIRLNPCDPWRENPVNPVNPV